MNTTTLTIEATRPYLIIDLQTGTAIRTTTYANRKRARNYAEKLNMEYGAHRYSAQLKEVVS